MNALQFSLQEMVFTVPYVEIATHNIIKNMKDMI